MKKVYQIKNPHSVKKAINFNVNNKSKTVVFESKNRDGILTFETGDAHLQGAIETSKYFKAEAETLFLSKITLLRSSDENDSENNAPDGNNANSGGSTKEYPEVTTWEAARTVLRSEYSVGATSNALKSPEGILAKAAELGISFPKLSINEN